MGIHLQADCATLQQSHRQNQITANELAVNKKWKKVKTFSLQAWRRPGANAITIQTHQIDQKVAISNICGSSTVQVSTRTLKESQVKPRREFRNARLAGAHHCGHPATQTSDSLRDLYLLSHRAICSKLHYRRGRGCTCFFLGHYKVFGHFYNAPTALGD